MTIWAYAIVVILMLSSASFLVVAGLYTGRSPDRDFYYREAFMGLVLMGLIPLFVRWLSLC